MNLMGVSIPKDVEVMLSGIMGIVTFDIPGLNVVSIFGEKSLPNSTVVFRNDTHLDKQKEHLYTNLEKLGYESHFMTVNMGSMYLIMLTTISCLILIGLFTPLKHVKVVSKARNYLINFFCWNFVIRLLVEATLELTITILLNKDFMTIHTSGFFEPVDYLMSVLTSVLLILMITMSVYFYWYNRSKLDDPVFIATWGDFYTGLSSHKKSALNYNRLFMLRRVLIAITLHYFFRHIWL